MRIVSVVLALLSATPAFAQSAGGALPAAPVPANSTGPGITAPPPGTPGAKDIQANAQSITREQAEQLALKNNPRITAQRLLALAAGQVTREVRSGELPQVQGNITAVDAEDGARIGAGFLTSSRLYTHAGAGGTLTQLLTDFGHTQNLVANSRLLAKAQEQTALATEQDVLFATDQAFYRLLNAQSLLDVAQATVRARGSVQQLTQALTRSALKSTLDLSIASADLSQSQLLQLDAENEVASASAALAALLATPAQTMYKAVEDAHAISAPPDDAAALIKVAQAERPDLLSLRTNAAAETKLARADELQYLPSISALATGGSTPVRPDGGVFTTNWWGAAGVNLTVPLFTGFRIGAEVKEAHLREQAIDNQATELSDNIARDVQVATLTAKTAFERIAVTETFEKQAAQSLALAKTRYQLGLSSIVELSQAQLQSTQASVAAVNARYDYLLALRSLDYAEGRLAP